MILHAYSIFDRKALVFHSPFWAINNAAASRSFGDLTNDPNSTVGRHPSDYVLYLMGHFDDATGGMLPVSPIEHIVDAISLVEVHAQFPFDQPAANGKVNTNG